MQKYEKLFKDAIEGMDQKDIAAFALNLFDVKNRSALQLDIYKNIKPAKKKEIQID